MRCLMGLTFVTVIYAVVCVCVLGAERSDARRWLYVKWLLARASRIRCRLWLRRIAGYLKVGKIGELSLSTQNSCDDEVFL